MTSELVIDVREKEIAIALLEDKGLVEYQVESREPSFSIGNVYAATVKKIMPGLNACFVDIGCEKDGFLHYLDLGLDYSSYEKYLKQVNSNRQNLYPIKDAKRLPILPKEGSITSVLTVGQEVLVQIVKEPISTKGPRITCDLSFAGRYLVLVPFGSKVSVSSKIKSNAERKRLKGILQNVLPENFGVIIRTVAEDVEADELLNEMEVLVHRFENVMLNVQKAQKTPKLVYEESSRCTAILRDFFNPTYENVYVNDNEVFEEVRDYVKLIAPDRVHIVKKYTGAVPIFDNFDVTKQIKSGFGKIVNFNKGAYLVIEHTEAMHVVDVNSGNRARGVDGQEANALDVNLCAADELARQLRLRDMGGIIIVDFIDMNLPEDRQLLYERMCKNMQTDRARHNILPLSKFGLMQITRQRVRPVMDVNVDEECPTCFGSGKIHTSINFVETLENKIAYLVKKVGIHKFTLYVHPYVYAYIKQGLISKKTIWKLKYGLGIQIVPSQKLGFLQYEFYDSNRQFIDMTQDIDA